MPVSIYTIDQSESWMNKISSLPDGIQDIYSTPKYYELNELINEGKAYCFIYYNDNGYVIYPFLSNPISTLELINFNNEFYDIQGAYGYNGILTSSTSPLLIKEFHREFLTYCKDTNIIAEFTRFNPIINNSTFSKYLDISCVNRNIIVDLTLSKDYIWKNLFADSVRKNVKKAHRHGLTVSRVPGNKMSKNWFNKFKRIYFDTLRRRNADDFYYFNKEYFTFLNRKLGTSSTYFFTLLGHDVIACELVIHYKYNSYSFLGGTLPQYFDMRPNDLLKVEIINSLKKNGFRYFCLGGGLKENDGIYAYKKRFSMNGERKFYIGKRVHNKNVYEKLVKTWKKKYPDKEKIYNNVFLKYRK